MINLEVKVKGVNELMKSLNKKTKDLEKEAQYSVEWVGNQTADLIKQNAPVDTHALVDAISFKPSKERGGWRSSVIVGIPARPNWRGELVQYGQYINDGTTHGYISSKVGFIDAGVRYAYETFPRELTKRVNVVINR